jgi:hypothetical protein
VRQVKATLFRLTFIELTEPVEVTLHGEVVGEYSPRAGLVRVGRGKPVQSLTVVRPKAPDLTSRAK